MNASSLTNAFLQLFLRPRREFVAASQFTSTGSSPVRPIPAAVAMGTPKRTTPLIMVADSDIIACQNLGQQLQDAGVRILYMKTTADCLDAAPIFHPDMIILNLPMVLEENLEASVLREYAAKSGNPPIIFLGSDNDEETVGRVHAYIKRLRGKWAVAQTLAELGELPAPVATRITTMTDMTAGLIESTPPAPEPGIARNDLVPVARLAAWIFRPIAENKQITLTVDVPAAGLLAVCDEVRIQRVLENLLSNAIKHSPVGGTVTLAARAENGILRLWVDDEGPGLTADEQPSLFADSENSLDEQAAEEYEDDRGLLVCQQIAEMHQGEIEMSNRLEGGAHFELRLPTEYQPRFITAGAPADRATTENRLSFTSSAQPGLVSMNLPDPSAN